MSGAYCSRVANSAGYLKPIRSIKKTMQSPEDYELFGTFSNIIGIIFNNWTALKLAVEHGMGGSTVDSIRKLNVMVEAVSQLLISGCSEWTDISDVLSDLMDSEFSTILEDNSSDEVAEHLIQLYRLFSAGDIQTLMLTCNSLPNTSPIHLRPPVQRISTNNQNIITDEDEDSNEQNVMVPEDDGWTVVKRK